jgi:uncharacterized protein (DUF2249 family)
MTIDAHTKIAALLKFHPDALEAIIKLNPKFVKLRNPVLRKLMAGRTTIAMAAKIGGCSLQDFYTGLTPLGFRPKPLVAEADKPQEMAPLFIKGLKTEKIVALDVRPILASGKDPLQTILRKIGELPTTHTLKIINTFEPTPLIKLLGEKGFATYIQANEDGVVETYFYKNRPAATEATSVIKNSDDWDAVYQKYSSHLHTIDVRSLPMPMPMHTILETVDGLPPQTALFVYHKRVPLFLLPELAQKGFEVRIKEIEEGEVHLLIFKA